MLWIPKLSRPMIWDSSECIPAGQSPISCQDRLPNNEDADPSLGVPCQKLLDCGGPPQTSWSRRRKKHHQSRRIQITIQSILEGDEICIREHNEGLLAVSTWN
jgi:hypothetical protein